MDLARKPNLKIPGTRSSLHNSQTIISSGIPSLDHVIGGGIPLGTIFLVEEDEYGKYSNVLFKYFLSEGVVCKHKLLLATLDNDPEKLLLEIPSPIDPEIEKVNKQDENTDESIKIAWRYKDLDQVQSTLGSGLQFGHYFDVSKPIDRSTLDLIDKNIWKISSLEKINFNSAYESLLIQIKNEIETGGFKNCDLKDSTNVLRVALQSVGSPFWQIRDSHKTDCKNEVDSLIQFLYCLRALIRSTFAVVFITIPVHLYQSSDDALRIHHLVDACIKLDSFAGTSRESNPSLRDYHGLFYMPKLSSVNTLAPYVPPTLDLAFKLKRKKFVIEKLHLPPELQESSEREQDDGSLLSCGSIKKRNLEF